MDHFRNKNAFDVLSNICRAYYIGLCKICLFFNLCYSKLFSGGARFEPRAHYQLH